jgi:hypothetical protein
MNEFRRRRKHVIEDEVRKALESKVYIPALTLALTIPDAYGQIEYPNESVGERYQQWFDRFCSFSSAGGVHKDSDILYFDGLTCYKLRCELLHSGDVAIKTEDLGGMPRNPVNRFDGVHTSDNVSFNIRVGASSSYGKGWIQGRESESRYNVTIGLEQLCLALCDAAEGYKRSSAERFDRMLKVGIWIDDYTDISVWREKS